MGHKELPIGHFSYMEPEQAYHASKLGMWFFLVTEVLLFGGLFAAFALFRWKYLDDFNSNAHLLNWKLGFTNTLVLLTSSYTMVRAVDAAQHGNNKKVQSWLVWTVVLGLAFFVIKGIEYNAKFSHHIYPSSDIFFGLYFIMTGIHAFHVLVGLLLMGWLWLLAKKNLYSSEFYTPVEVCGLYWHLVDLIWIFLFPILYLMGGIGAGAH